MKLSDNIKALVRGRYGIDLETIDASSPERLAEMIRTKTEEPPVTDVPNNVPEEKDAWDEINAAGICVFILDCHATDHPEGLPLRLYVRIERNGRETDVHIANRSYPMGSPQRYFFSSEDITPGTATRAFRDALGVSLRLFIDPKGFDFIRYSQEYNLNCALEKLDELKKGFLKSIKRDIRAYPRLAATLALPENYESLPVEELFSVVEKCLLSRSQDENR